MKNKRIVDSWNKIEPDSAAKARMLDSILTRNHAGQSEKEKLLTMTNTFSWKRYAPIAACLVVVVALVAVLSNSAGWFRGKTLVADLDGGNTLSFHKADVVGGEAKFAWDANWGESISRDFTVDESDTLFGDLSVTGGAIFRSTDGGFMHYEGNTDRGIKVILSANGFPVTDTPVTGNEKASEINGIPVAAGYFITDANSKGIKTIIYFASFEANGTTVYLELGGDESNSDDLRSEIGNLINMLTQNPPDTSMVTAE